MTATSLRRPPSNLRSNLFWGFGVGATKPGNQNPEGRALDGARGEVRLVVTAVRLTSVASASPLCTLTFGHEDVTEADLVFELPLELASKQHLRRRPVASARPWAVVVGSSDSLGFAAKG
jgi:hypothetical protein